ncbi:unnamed protein product [Hermetia illucens]|uniref:Lipase n=1 Tax=Hermetia illucens TaxID=343691 RepID=A0A7R8YMZ9_HERIL|nr:lipase 1-like [Hermetia illucens]CAD7078751.1 unnamed protein product [Hermetia illucens]
MEALTTLKSLIVVLSLYFNPVTPYEDNVTTTNLPRDIAEDAALTTVGLIFKYGFPVEKYNVTTQDGYVLEVHRIPKPGKQPVLLQHGFLDSSATFVLMGPDKGLAYILSQQGYDVWLGNSRGNRYSRKHVNISADDERFWKFSWHEMGVYDLPAVIDFILRKSDFPKLHYIGHSQGTTSFFVMCSQRPNYNSKILLMQAFAPVVYFFNVRTPFKTLLKNSLDTMSFASSTLGLYELLPNLKRLSNFSQTACWEHVQTHKYCSNLLFILAGYNEPQMNMTMLPVVYGHIPAGASIMQLIHYGQILKSGVFQQYDYGRLANFLRYRTFEPPRYNLSRVTAPVILHYADNDYLSAPEDVETLAKQLPGIVSKRMVPMRRFNHIDFIWGINSKELLYSHVISNMKKIELGR